jgi:outer membrane lipoprotein SlyB
MKPRHEILEDHLEKYQQQLASLKSYLRELKDMTAKHGTDEVHFREDLKEAEHNIKYYTAEIERIKQELKECGKTGGAYPGGGSIMPRTVKHGIGSAIFSSIGFVAGAIFGSRLKSRKADKAEKSPDE